MDEYSQDLFGDQEEAGPSSQTEVIPVESDSDSTQPPDSGEYESYYEWEPVTPPTPPRKKARSSHTEVPAETCSEDPSQSLLRRKAKKGF
ncbi:uncharacterized protein LOC117334590 isoform X2 [Pecten maximus]|uniref:uncharacterized protein LOC117319876 isoform X2 n=1 Tax=Pecten maximus TaxID=6579 RepID=UPI001458ADDE|nr:uncharacterized protein LOC117319876 isoform X2 [Pecten maximus]XP_033750175.1 uncharacterized protein LOC117334590 isoform X2 [Pecten maximus]